MKVLQIGASWFSYQFSGLERYYAELVTRLPALGAEVVGVIYELKDAPNVNGLKLVSFGSQKKSVARQFLDQRRILKGCLWDGPDLIVSHCTPSLFPSLNQLGSRPLVCHVHGPRYMERIVEGANPLSVRLSKYIEQRVYARSDRFITLSQYMKRMLVDSYGIQEARISVIPGGVSVDQFKQSISRQEARSRLILPLDRPIILTVRRLERRMGLHNLIEAMREVVKFQPEVLLLIAGKGSLRNELDQDIGSKNLSQNVRMMGTVTDQMLPLLYRAADFSIVPSTDYEGFGLTLIESLASGTPVLGTPVGAIPEVLRPLSESLLLEGASAQLLVEGIRDVLFRKRILPSMESCEEYATQNYAWPIIARKIHTAYRNVLGVG
jgi:glycosyltransferase involved in cell wall biosynthesis